jgi:hypothetical protein
MTGAVKLTVQLVRNKFAGNRQLQGICTMLNLLYLINEKRHQRTGGTKCELYTFLTAALDGEYDKLDDAAPLPRRKEPR